MFEQLLVGLFVTFIVLGLLSSYLGISIGALLIVLLIIVVLIDVLLLITTTQEPYKKRMAWFNDV